MDNDIFVLRSLLRGSKCADRCGLFQPPNIFGGLLSLPVVFHVGDSTVSTPGSFLGASSGLGVETVPSPT